MSIICPAIMPLEADPHEYRAQIEKVEPFASRIQIDVMDGVFAPNKNLNPVQLWWPENILADIHFMYQDPTPHLTTLISLQPNMIILHYESRGQILESLQHIKKFGIKTGIALLQDTDPMSAEESIKLVDHVLIFAGKLGNAGQADMTMLDKVSRIRSINPEVEIGWDGGASLDNCRQLAENGIDVINVGSAIRDAEDSADAYQTLVEAAISS